MNKCQQIDTNCNNVKIVNKNFDTLVSDIITKENGPNQMWLTLIPLLIGASLTFLTTFLFELWKTSKEKALKKQQQISRGYAKIYLITQVLKDLAMYKVHKQYYLRASQLDQNSNREDSFRKHYKKGQVQRAVEAKLDENIADYIELVTEFYILINNLNLLQKHFREIFNFKHPKSINFADIYSQEILEKNIEIEEKRLNNEYKKLTNILEQLQTSMK